MCRAQILLQPGQGSSSAEALGHELRSSPEGSLSDLGDNSLSSAFLAPPSPAARVWFTRSYREGVHPGRFTLPCTVERCSIQCRLDRELSSVGGMDPQLLVPTRNRIPHPSAYWTGTGQSREAHAIDPNPSASGRPEPLSLSRRTRPRARAERAIVAVQRRAHARQLPGWLPCARS